MGLITFSNETDSLALILIILAFSIPLLKKKNKTQILFVLKHNKNFILHGKGSSASAQSSKGKQDCLLLF